MHHQTTAGYASPEPAPASREVAVLSSAVLRATRLAYAERADDLAERAGVRPCTVSAVEDGTLPAWGLPYDVFAALADALRVLNPDLRSLWETAAACDLLLSHVLAGDQTFATDVLTDDTTRDLAVGLLRWAVTGEFRLPGHVGCMQVPVLWAWHEECGGWVCPACGWCLCETGPGGCGHRGQLLGDVDLALLRHRASALAKSASPDAWVGAEILAMAGGAR